MRSSTVKALLFVAVLSLLAADVSIGCGQGYVYGPVTQKYAIGADTGNHIIAVSGHTYDVPLGFFNQVRVGDTVKYDGKAWSVVQAGQQGQPAVPPSLTQPATPSQTP